MRWHKARKGDVRIVTFFAWFPVEIDREVRWFERVTVQQELNGLPLGWINRQFVD